MGFLDLDFRRLLSAKPHQFGIFFSQITTYLILKTIVLVTIAVLVFNLFKGKGKEVIYLFVLFHLLISLIT